MLKNKVHGSWFAVHSYGFKIKMIKYMIVSLILCAFGFIFSYAQEEFVYDAKNKRDPFIPLVTSDGRLLKLEQEEGTQGLLLEGIIYDDKGISCAIVNGEVVRVGDEAGGFQVLKIQKDKVVFIKDGQPTEIELKKEE